MYFNFYYNTGVHPTPRLKILPDICLCVKDLVNDRSWMYQETDIYVQVNHQKSHLHVPGLKGVKRHRTVNYIGYQSFINIFFHSLTLTS